LLARPLRSLQRQKEREKPDKRCRLIGRFLISVVIGTGKKSLVNNEN
jgi:hypothetical protein